MKNKLEGILEEFETKLSEVSDSSQLEQLRINYLGKKGQMTAVMKDMRDVPVEQKKDLGALANVVKGKIADTIKLKEDELALLEIESKLASEQLDIHFPARGVVAGKLHPLMVGKKEIEDIFVELGYSIAEGPDIENDFYNFEALNIPADHPARDMHDTFYVQNNLVMRTHTSPVQIRVMESQEPPIKIIAPGKVFRKDSDVTHSPVFHQVEGLYISKGVTFAELKGTLEVFLRKYFGKDKKVRFRPSYFPFTEPSAEVDVECVFCGGKDSECRICKGSGWIEVLGCGMVDPNVFAKAGIDSEKYSGFAFGIGVERLVMLKHGINDIRLFYTNYLHFLKQF